LIRIFLEASVLPNQYNTELLRPHLLIAKTFGMHLTINDAIYSVFNALFENQIETLSATLCDFLLSKALEASLFLVKTLSYFSLKESQKLAKHLFITKPK
jgi:hypothetical protein